MSNSTGDSSSGVAWLCVRAGGHELDRIRLSREPVIIGRSKSATLQLDDERISRRHAEISRDPLGRITLRDLGSRNGTLIDGQTVTEAELSSGDSFAIGAFELCVITEGAQPFVKAKPTTVADAPNTRYSTFGAKAGRIDTTHLNTLTDFAHELLTLPTRRARLERLCHLMVDGAFHGRRAVALRMARGDSELTPQALCTPARNERLKEDYDSMPRLSRGLLSAVRRQPAPTFASNVTGGKGGGVELSIAPEQAGEQAAAAVPLRVDDESVDVLYVSFPPQFGTVEWLTLVALAAQQYQHAESTIAVQTQATRHAAIERELSQAREIQQRLVPRYPSTPGMEIAIGFEPCKWVGGDYVDVVSNHDGRTVLVIADVTGKGLPAALVASELHAMVRAFLRAGADLTTMMNGLNEHLCEYLDDRIFVTAAALAIDPLTGEVECVNAGHPPVLCIDPTGKVRPLQQAENLPLGVCQEPMRSQHDALVIGELLAMYTDGLSELKRDDGQMLCVEGLSDELAGLYRMGPTRTLGLLSGAVGDLLDAIQGDRAAEDDRTFLLGRRVAAVDSSDPEATGNSAAAAGS
ncbi:SpoIIE family protein phosphatase [Planctomycetales bacterium ZRK34]|nr:SpoIIE family protein phosphatase [Planctomycetales bacterium ZRK34]